MVSLQSIEEIMMADSAKCKTLSHIRGKGRGWAFSATDFILMLNRWKVGRFLADLIKEGKIRRSMLISKLQRRINKGRLPRMCRKWRRPYRASMAGEYIPMAVLLLIISAYQHFSIRWRIKEYSRVDCLAV
jgi:hypothetical protein